MGAASGRSLGFWSISDERAMDDPALYCWN
jgi:hypothetical protein